MKADTSNTQQHIVAMGGGGFSMETSTLLDEYILSLAPKSAKICFLGTASGDSSDYIRRFYKRFTQLDCRPTHLELFAREQQDIGAFLCAQDVIYVGGGNTANMLEIWKIHGVDLALKQALENGVVLAGLSAGSICWFEQGLTDSFGADYQPLPCLGFLNGSNCPHYHNESSRRPLYHQFVEEGAMAPGYAADDGAALYFCNGEFSEAVSSRTEAGAYRVSVEQGLISEESVTIRLLS